MTSNRFVPRSVPLRFDFSRALVPFTDTSRTELIALGDRLGTARGELLCNTESRRGAESAFVDQPERMLAEYGRTRGRSELGRILSVGKRLRDSVDRVVVIGAEPSVLGARAMFEAGCHPYHNELSRGDRGGRPRIYFAGSDFDTDAVQGLLDLLRQTHRAATVDDRWAIVVIDQAGDTPETLAVLRCLLALGETHGRAFEGGNRDGDNSRMAGGSIVPITIAESPLDKLVAAIGCAERFDWSSELPQRHSMFAAAGLLPAAVMGMDVVQFLQGAVMMNERFRSAPAGDNPALDHAAIAHVIGSRGDTAGRRIVPWASALAATARCCELLQSLWDLPPPESRLRCGPQTNLIVELVRRDRLVVPSMPDATAGAPPTLSGTSFAELQLAAVQRAQEWFARQRFPSADLVLPALDESSLGQLFQMMMLAAAIESRLAAMPA